MANYRLDSVSCTSAAGTSTFTVKGASPKFIWPRAITPMRVSQRVRPPAWRLTIRKVTLGGVGSFSYG